MYTLEEAREAKEEFKKLYPGITVGVGALPEPHLAVRVQSKSDLLRMPAEVLGVTVQAILTDVPRAY